MDYTKAIEVAKDVFWVGVTDEKSFFRSNSYLFKDENEAVLIDPGLARVIRANQRQSAFRHSKRAVKICGMPASGP